MCSRLLSCLITVALVSWQIGCTAYDMAAIEATNQILDDSDDDDWELFSLDVLVGSGEKFKGKTFRFHVKSRTDDDVGTRIAEIERVDSTYVYGWRKSAEYERRHLVKIDLSEVIKAEIHKSQVSDLALGIGVLAIPFIVVIAVVGLTVLVLKAALE